MVVYHAVFYTNNLDILCNNLRFSVTISTMITNTLLRQSFRRFPMLSQSMVNRNPITLAAGLSSGFVKPTWTGQHLVSSKERRGILSGNQCTALAIRGSATQISETPPSFAKRYYIERVFTAAMFPLFPAALFIHNPIMDYALALTIALHTHWGMEAVVEDYARPLVIGETLAKMSHYALYVFSVLMFAGLLHFNYTDVGITKAFEMIWSL